jgi:hypothetical protein
LAADLEDERASAASGFGEACKRVLPGLHVPFFEKIRNAVAIEDTAVPKQVARGLPLVGDTPYSPHFYAHQKPSTIALEELMRTAPERRERVEKSMEARGQGRDPSATEDH